MSGGKAVCLNCVAFIFIYILKFIFICGSVCMCVSIKNCVFFGRFELFCFYFCRIVFVRFYSAIFLFQRRSWPFAVCVVFMCAADADAVPAFNFDVFSSLYP